MFTSAVGSNFTVLFLDEFIKCLYPFIISHVFVFLVQNILFLIFAFSITFFGVFCVFSENNNIGQPIFLRQSSKKHDKYLTRTQF